MAPNKNGPRKLKSWPLFAAQNVYNVRAITTAAVRMAASRITFPVANQPRDQYSHLKDNFNSKIANTYDHSIQKVGTD